MRGSLDRLSFCWSTVMSSMSTSCSMTSSRRPGSDPSSWTTFARITSRPLGSSARNLEAVASVKEDLHMYQEIMSRPASPGNRATGSQRDPRKKRQHEESPCKDPPKKPRPTWDSKQKQWDDKQKAAWQRWSK